MILYSPQKMTKQSNRIELLGFYFQLQQTYMKNIDKTDPSQQWVQLT